MCGASREQKDMYAKQSAFYDTMTASYKSQFAQFQGIMDTLTKSLQPIINAGPNQEGFGPQELTALNTEATEGVAENYRQASDAVHEAQAARGGGSEFLPSGADAMLNEGVANAAAATRSGLKTKITEANYDTGRRQYWAANDALSRAAGLENPTGFADAATGAGSAASKTATDIASAGNAMWSAALGAVGGIGGALVGNLNAGPFGGKKSGG